MARAILAIVAGLVVLAGAVLVAFGVMLFFVDARPDESAPIDLAPWLWLELIVGSLAAVAAGHLCRRLGRRVWPPLVLAGIVLLLGLVEAAEIIVAPMIDGLDLHAPLPLVLAAPIAGALAVLAGAYLIPGSRGPDDP